MEILDAHQHIGIIEGFARSDARPAAGESPEEAEYQGRLRVMDRAGIQRTVLGPAYQYLMPNGIADTRRVNDHLAAYRDRNPERFPFAIGAIEPRHGEASLEEIQRIKRDLGMVGVMFHNRLQGCYVDSPWMVKCVRAMVDEGLAPFVHCHHGSLLEAPWRMEYLAAEFPETRFLILDGLSGFEETEHFYRIVERRDNLWFETGMWSGGAGKVNETARVLGADRLVFGSGAYSVGMGSRGRETVEAVQRSRLSEDEKAGVFARNLYGLLGKAPLGEVAL